MNEVVIEENEETVVESVSFELKKDDTSFPSTGLISAGTYSVIPSVVLIDPTNYTVVNGNLGLLAVSKVTPTISFTNTPYVFTADGQPKAATAVAYGIGTGDDREDLTALLTFIYAGKGSTVYGPLNDPPTERGTYTVTASLASNVNYNAASATTDLTINCAVAPEIVSFTTSMGKGANGPATISPPAGTSAGDLLVVGLTYEKGTGTTITPPAGWTFIAQANQGNNVGIVTYYKIATAFEIGPYAFNLSSSPKWAMGISRITGADISNPIGAAAGNSGPRSVNVVAPSVQTSGCNSLVMNFYTNKTNATYTPAPGTVEVYDDPNSKEGLTSNMLAYFVQAEAGTTGTRTAVASRTDTWASATVAIRSKTSGANERQRFTGTQETTNTADVMMTETISVTAYPNPVTNRLNLIMEGQADQPNSSQLVIYDGLGRVIPVNSTWYNDENRLEMDFSELNRGLYIINVRTGNGIQVLRIFKQSE
jgi:hypothetical protein